MQVTIFMSIFIKIILHTTTTYTTTIHTTIRELFLIWATQSGFCSNFKMAYLNFFMKRLYKILLEGSSVDFTAKFCGSKPHFINY